MTALPESQTPEQLATQGLLKDATLGALFGELASRGLAYAAWNSSGDLVRANNAIRTNGYAVFRPDIDNFSDHDILMEFKERGYRHVVWNDAGDVISKSDPPHFHDDEVHFEEATARLRRGDLFEALIHLERAIPALDGLHDAVRNLQR